MKNGFTITQRNAVVEQHLWCIDTVMAQYRVEVSVFAEDAGGDSDSRSKTVTLTAK